MTALIARNARMLPISSIVPSPVRFPCLPARTFEGTVLPIGSIRDFVYPVFANDSGKARLLQRIFCVLIDGSGIQNGESGRDPMTKAAVVLTSFLLSFLFLAGQGSAKGRRPEKEPVPPPPPVQAPAPSVERGQGQYLFSPAETAEIRGYYRTAPPPSPPGPPAGKKVKSLPPGLQKKVERGKELPPGWQKKIARGEVIDAQVYAHSHPLPPELVRRLPPGPAGTVVVTVEGKVVRLMEATMTILDVFDLL